MKTEDKVGLERVVDTLGACANFGRPVEKSFGEALECCGRVGCVVGIFDPCAKRFRADGSDGFCGFTDEGNASAKRFKFGFEQLGDVEGHVALAHGVSVANDEPALLHFCPISADVSGINGDVEVCKGLVAVGRG